MLDAFVEDSGEISLLTSSGWTNAVTSGLEDGRQLLAGNTAALVKAPDYADMMKQAQRLMEINQRLTQRRLKLRRQPIRLFPPRPQTS